MQKDDSRPRWTIFYRKSIRRWTLLPIIIIGLNHSVSAKASPCAGKESPKITVGIVREDVKERADVSRAELEELAIASGREDHLPVFGGYASSLGYKVDVDSEAKNIGNGEYCAEAASIRVVVLIKDRTIHLARETEARPCLLQATRAHEMRHARADDQAVDDQAGPLVDELRAKLIIPPTAVGRSSLEARSQLTSAISRLVREQFNKVYEYRRHLNQVIDSPDDLARLRTACSGPGADYL